MKVAKLLIKNFRSIRNLEIKMGDICAFIGPNNSGKSNILRAFNIILGESYPSVRSFSEEDFRNYDASERIEIKVLFDESFPDSKGNWIAGFSLTFDNNSLEYLATDETGNPITYTFGYPIRVSNEMKEHIPLIYIPIDRTAQSQLRPTKWTLYGRILLFLAERFRLSGREGDFQSKIQEAMNILKIDEMEDVENRLNTIIKEQTGLSEIALEFNLIDPINFYKSLRPYLKENSLKFDPENLGMGIQSNLIVALMRIYKDLLAGETSIMLIDEPEVFLHPHSCRHFYRILKALAESGTQIIYSTHSPYFIDPENPNMIYLIRNESETKVFRCTNMLDKNSLKLLSKFDTDFSEIFFARKVVLVEGDVDKIALKRAFELKEIDLDRENISILACGSINEIPFVANLLDSFKIYCCALCDGDPAKPTEPKNVEIKNIIGKENCFTMYPDLESIFGLSKKLKKTEALEYFDKFSKFEEFPATFKDLIETVINNKEFEEINTEEDIPF